MWAEAGLMHWLTALQTPASLEHPESLAVWSPRRVALQWGVKRHLMAGFLPQERTSPLP